MCSIEGCEGGVFGRGWCSKHYTRWQRHGDPLVTSRTPPIEADATEKRCPRCGNVKPIGEFGLRSSGKPKGYCAACEADYQKRYVETPEGREAHRAASTKWSNGNHDYFLQRRYGITRGQYDEMLAAQGGGCAICGTTTPGGRDQVFQVDHCHSKNHVRGLLCGPCNRGLGQFRDDPARIRAAAAYLERTT